MFPLIPAALGASMAALRNPGQLSKILTFRVGIFTAAATVAAVTYTVAPPAQLEASTPRSSPAADSQKKLIKRRSSIYEPANAHALVRALAPVVHQ
jgi:hypothetical protein